MAKKNRTDLATEKVQPSFLSQYVEEDHSLDSLKEYRVVPRLKIIQSPSAQELKEAFGEGSVIVRPGDTMVCSYKDRGSDEPTSFVVVPVFFFTEFAKWKDLRDKTDSPNVLERTFDKSSIMAKRAADRNERYELYPGHDQLPDNEQRFYRYVQHFRFISIIYGAHPLCGTATVLSFERGEFGQGKNFISAISLRKIMTKDGPAPMPLWAQLWRFSVQYHDPSTDKKWYGYKFQTEGSIQPEEAETFNNHHKEFAELFEQQRLVVDESGETDQEEVIPEDAEL
jgi:hypothetical protein